MTRLIGPHGELRDFFHRPGDPAPPTGQYQPPRQWGRRVLLAADGFKPTIGTPPLTGRNTLIETHDLGRTYPINVQVRFAQSDAQGNPILPFTPAFPPSLTAGHLVNLTVRRGSDEVAPVAVDTYQLLADLTGSAGQTIPFDIITGRSLGVDIEFPDIGGTPVGLWVEAIATIVTDISEQDKIKGWKTSLIQGVLGPAISPANVVLLPAHPDRAQFVVVNMSANADLIVCFGPGANWGPPNVVGSVVLPRNMFATYESPVGGYRGIVTGSWTAGAVGGALVTEGTYY